MTDTPLMPTRERWAHFRFGVISPLLTCPPDPGELSKALDELSAKVYVNPATKQSVRFGRSTIERWLYAAKNEPQQPVQALSRKPHGQAGKHPSVSAQLTAAIELQYREHPRWSFKLHHDNLVAREKSDPALEVPSVAVLRRFMRKKGFVKLKKPRRRRDAVVDAPDFEPREKRSFEVGHVHALWHSDFHFGSLHVVNERGEWNKPILLAFLDDCSRMVLHLQWYLFEDTQAFVHGLSQAILKRGLPRALLTDNGAAMRSDEVREGLFRLSIAQHMTLPYCPEQNGKQERFWGQVEGRLMAMLEGEPGLTLQRLNEATQAWVELEYHRAVHSELKKSPLSRMVEGPSVVRPSPASQDLVRAFRSEVLRTQRRSDGTITVGGVRFEVPTVFRPILRPTIRYAAWDLSSIDLVDPRTGTHLATLLPLDKLQNASGKRRVVSPATSAQELPREVGIAPHLAALMREYAATGLPPAYVPDGRERTTEIHEHHHDEQESKP